MRKIIVVRHLAAIVAVLAPRVNAAQMVIPPITQAQCTTAVADLSAGNRTAGWELIGACGQAGASAVATALRATTVETDSVYLKKLSGVARSIRHPDVLAAAQAVAINSGATVASRAVSLLVLLAQYDVSATLPSAESWVQFTTVRMGAGSCNIYRATPAGYAQVASMPSDYLNTITATADQLSRDSQQPAVLRDLADCVRTMLSRAVPRTVAPGDLTVTYVCENKFRIANASYNAAAVKYRLQNSTNAKDTSIAAGGWIDVWTDIAGSLVVSINGVDLQPVANGAQPCS